MGFIEGMILCFIGGWLNSYLYRKYLRKKNRAYILWFGIWWCGGLITFDFLIYIDVINANWFEVFPWIHIPDTIHPSVVGRYWMFTPGAMFGLPMPLPVENYFGTVWHIFAIFFFLSYIFSFTIGQNLGRFMHGRLTFEKGAWFLFRSTKMIQKSKEKIEKKKLEQE